MQLRPGRHITDNVVVCQELIHTLQRKMGRKGGMVLKIDLEKACDRLEWPFIEDTLLDVGLPVKMVNVIMKCVPSASFKLLWNSEGTDSVTQTRGMRQGDPLSPYLFVLCLEHLAHRIQQEVARGCWKPLKALRQALRCHTYFLPMIFYCFLRVQSPK